MLQTGERLASKIRVRLIEPDDSLAGLTALLHRAYKQHADKGIKALAAFQPEEVTRRRISGGECFVATYLGRVVGTILFKDAAHTVGMALVETEASAGGNGEGHWFDRGDVASFAQFAVEPEFQGRGIGTELMGRAEQRARETGAAEVALSTPEPAEWLIKMYERHGYRIVERRQWAQTNYISAIMSKNVRGEG